MQYPLRQLSRLDEDRSAPESGRSAPSRPRSYGPLISHEPTTTAGIVEWTDGTGLAWSRSVAGPAMVMIDSILAGRRCRAPVLPVLRDARRNRRAHGSVRGGVRSVCAHYRERSPDRQRALSRRAVLRRHPDTGHCQPRRPASARQISGDICLRRHGGQSTFAATRAASARASLRSPAPTTVPESTGSSTRTQEPPTAMSTVHCVPPGGHSM